VQGQGAARLGLGEPHHLHGAGWGRSRHVDHLCGPLLDDAAAVREHDRARCRSHRDPPTLRVRELDLPSGQPSPEDPSAAFPRLPRAWPAPAPPAGPARDKKRTATTARSLAIVVLLQKADAGRLRNLGPREPDDSNGLWSVTKNGPRYNGLQVAAHASSLTRG